MIKTFTCKETEGIFKGNVSRKLPADIQSRAQLVLTQIDEATEIAQLRIPPSNRLKLLQGKLAGFWSIRINQKWRIIFRWENGQASDVEIIDYH